MTRLNATDTDMPRGEIVAWIGAAISNAESEGYALRLYDAELSDGETVLFAQLDGHGREAVFQGPARELGTFWHGYAEAERRSAAKDSPALDRIAAAMSGVEWSPDVLDEVAGILSATGRAIEPPT